MSRIFLKPNSNWTEANARFAAYFFDNGELWVDLVKNSNNDYYCEIPSGYPSVIFTRMNPSTTVNNWNNAWNQTNDLSVVEGTGKIYTVAAGAWSKGGGSWSAYTDPNPPQSTYTVTIASDEFEFDQNEQTVNAGESVVFTIVSELAEAPEGYVLDVIATDGVWDPQTKTITIASVNRNYDISVSSSIHLPWGFYITGDFNGWASTGSTLTPADHLVEFTDKYNDEYTQYTIELDATYSGEQIKIIYLYSEDGATWKTWDRWSSDLTFATESDDANGILPTITSTATLYIADLGNDQVRAGISVSEEVDDPQLFLDLTEVSVSNKTIVKGETFTTVVSGNGDASVLPSSLLVKHGSTEYTIADTEYVTDNEDGSYTITIPNVTKHITIKAEALLPVGSYLYYCANGERHFEKISDNMLPLREEISVDFKFSDHFDLATIDGEHIEFKIVESTESGVRKWYNPNTDTINAELNPKDPTPSGGSVMTGKVENNAGLFGSDMGCKFDAKYDKYRIYFEKYDETEGFEWGRYWVTQTSNISWTTQNLDSLVISNYYGSESITDNIGGGSQKAYLWDTYEISWTFKTDVDDIEITITPEELLKDEWDEYKITYTADNYDSTDADTHPRENLTITITSIIGGQGVWSLVDENGNRLEDFVSDPQEEGQFVLKNKTLDALVYGIEYDFETKGICSFTKDSHNHSGVGVGSDINIFLEDFSVQGDKLHLAQAWTADIYLREVDGKARLWFDLKDATKTEITLIVENQTSDNLIKPGFELDKCTGIYGTKHTEGDITTFVAPYHTYLGAKVEGVLVAGGEYSIKSATQTNNDTITMLTPDAEYKAPFSIEEVANDISFTLTAEKKEMFNKIILFDKNNKSIMLYPRTSLSQIVNPLGESLEEILTKMLTRIAELEAKVN